jgi:ABC-type glycerol-3-phosphate transport system permease component
MPADLTPGPAATATGGVSGTAPSAAAYNTWQRERARLRRRRVAGRSAGYFFLVALSGGTIFPLLWMLVTSVRTRDTVFSGGVIPSQVNLDGYRRAWSQLDYPSHFLTSLVVTTLTVAGVLALATLGGYSFAKLNFPGKQIIYVTLLSTLMLPVAAMVIPLFLELKTLHLLNTRQGLILTYIGTSLPFAMFLMRAFFETLPDELVHAARVDGAGEFMIFWRIMLPLAAPGVATVLIFQFMSTWNEFMYAQTFLQTPEYLPLQPVLYTVVGRYATDWPLLTAALTMSILPIVLVYIRMQRRFVAGLTLGALKF